MRIHEVPDEFVFRTKDEESCKEWVATLKSAREASINNSKKEQNGVDFPDLLNKDKTNNNGKNGGGNEIFPDLDMSTGAPVSGGSSHTSATPSAPPPESAPAPAPSPPKKERKSIKELRAIAHGAGYNTRGMERSDLEKIAEYYAPVSEQQARQRTMNGQAQTQAAQPTSPPASSTTSHGGNFSSTISGVGTNGGVERERERQRKAQEEERIKRQKEEEERQRVQQQQEYVKQKREEELKRQQAATAAAAAKKAAEDRERERVRQQQQQWNSNNQQWKNSHQQQSNGRVSVEEMFESTRFFGGGTGGVGGPRRRQAESGVGGPRRKHADPVAPVPPSAPPMPNGQPQPPQPPYQQQQQQQKQYQQFHQNHFQQHQQQQHQRFHPYQQQAAPPQQPNPRPPPPTNPSASQPPPRQPQQQQQQPQRQTQSPPRNPQTRATDPTSPLNQKYAKAMSNQKINSDDSANTDEAIAMIKRNILIHWALVPPQYNMLRPIDQLLTNIQTVFPPFGNVARHEYFNKWKVVKREDLVLSSAMGGASDETKLKKAHRRLRVFLHPDRLPREFDAKQTFVCKMLWDVSNDAWEEFLKQKDDLDWVQS